MAEYDVVIAGAGPTGLALANFLGRDGVRTLLVERNPTTVAEPRAVSIDDESLRTVQAIGLADGLVPDLNLGYGVHYFGRGRTPFLVVEPTTLEFGWPKRNAFRQPILEARLRDGLARFDAVTTHFSTTLTGFEQHEGGVTVRLAGADAPREVRGRWLVGCDGGRSTVRKLLDIAMRGSSFEERWLVVDTEDDPTPSWHTRVRARPERPSINLPGPHRTRRWEFKLHPHEDEAAMLADVTIERLLADEGTARHGRIVRRIVYTFHARLADRWREGRVFLAGDAAHLTPPFAGQGMNTGLRDATNLAWKLAAVASGKLPEAVLDTYETERRDHAWSMIELALAIGRVMAPKSRLHAFATEVGFRMLRVIPPLRSWFAQMRYKPAPRFREGFVVPGGTGVGRMLGQPRLALGGNEGLLDDFAGPGFALLAVCVAEPPRLGHPLWRDLGASQLAIGAAPGPAWLLLEDPRAEATRLVEAYRGKVLLVRPDRYLAAVFAPGEADAAATSLSATLGAGWQRRSIPADD